MKAKLLELGKDSLIYGVGSVLTRSIGLISLPLFTAYLTPEEFGILALLAILTMAAQPIFSLGLSAAMGPSYFSGDNREKKSEAVWTAFSISLVSSTLLIAIAWIFPDQLALLIRVSSEHSLVVALALTGCALNVMATAFSQRVQFERQARRYVCISVTSALSAIAVSALTVVYLDWGILGMVTGQIVSAALNFLFFGFYSLNETMFNVSQKMARELLRTGLPLVPSFAFLFVLMNNNKYFLEALSGVDAVGLYSVGFSLGSVISIITAGFTKAWYPFFISYIDRQNEVKSLFGRVYTYYVILGGYLCLLVFLFAEPVVYILANESFHEAYLVVGTVALAYFFQAMFNLFLPGTYFSDQIRYVPLIQAVTVILAIPINYIFIENLGLLGAGIGLVAGNLILAINIFIWNKVNFSKYVEVDYEWRRVGCVTVVYIITAVVFLMIPSSSLLVQLLIAFSGALFAALFLSKILTQSEIRQTFSVFRNDNREKNIG